MVESFTCKGRHSRKLYQIKYFSIPHALERLVSQTRSNKLICLTLEVKTTKHSNEGGVFEHEGRIAEPAAHHFVTLSSSVDASHGTIRDGPETGK